MTVNNQQPKPIFFTTFSRDKIAIMRELLQKRIKISHVKVSRFLYSSVGKLSFNYLGEYIQR
ncbi:alpha/beta hydrolase [Calothrix sp. FACHB-1219]|uniref:alpha/beta hydrolase n=1 Tax=unclassified Calothrix TaxID=2619626 RepID=UPI0016842433|nr:alpha/beta hydrolase [Calothrix sp. FACHB-168]MBD2217079.1 alpha/beta hydrolase [Calothrix sp. FACHB-1219]